MKKSLAIVVLGTTSSGKTKLAVDLARRYNGEIVGADSRQVYKGMDIGTGKDLEEYGEVPYHLIDVVSPMTNFNLAKYQRLAKRALEDIASRGRLPIIAGGTGLYLQALVDDYQLKDSKPDLKRREDLEALGREELWKRLLKINPDFAARVNDSDRLNPRRLVRYLEILEDQAGTEAIASHHNRENFLLFGLDCPKDILEERIRVRLRDRLDKQDLVGEVKRLHENGVSWKRLESFGLEYRFVSRYLRNVAARQCLASTYDDMVDKLGTAIIQFSKRQKTWWRRWEKQGIKINWVESPEEAYRLVERFTS
jgi:tRNA dimethylallyltransferase